MHYLVLPRDRIFVDILDIYKYQDISRYLLLKI